MTMETTRVPPGPDCPPDATLHDLADGLLEARAATAAAAHAAGCPRCAAVLARLERLRALARALPREVEPPPALWEAVRAEIAPADAHRARRLAVAARAGAPAWRRPALLAAAAVGLMALSSAGTVLVLRGGGRERPVAAERPAPRAEPMLRPATLGAVDAGHVAAVAELERALVERRSDLAPETVAAVERSLRVVDQALAEARAALARDPGNADLADLVAAAYRQKLTVLRRATELAPRS